MKKEKCILLFSGGRDSTVSAVYLAKQYEYLYLATIQSAHLKGIENVYLRLKELQTFLQSKCTWNLYRKIENLPIKNLKTTTCLPCHAYYIALVQNIAISNNIRNISLGYVGYQKCWEEQSDYAKLSLRRYLDSVGLNLLLPVESVTEKEEMKQCLRELNLTEDALEQKCLKSSFNIRLKETEMEQQIDAWIDSIKSISNLISNNYNTTLIDNLVL